MIEEVQDKDRAVVEMAKREIREELKTKKGKSRRIVGLITSGVGGALYLILGIMFFITGMGYYLWYYVPLLIAGGISQTGTIVAVYKVKVGGSLLLTSLPVSIVFGIILAMVQPYYYYSPYAVITVFQFILLPFPFPHSAHVIAGGILCLLASDRDLREF
jgi:hypothetical protein